MGTEAISEFCETDNNKCAVCPIAQEKVKSATSDYLHRNGAHLPDYALVKKDDGNGVAGVWFGNAIAKVENCKLILAEDKDLSGPSQEETL